MFDTNDRKKRLSDMSRGPTNIGKQTECHTRSERVYRITRQKQIRTINRAEFLCKSFAGTNLIPEKI
jgi:hypothetical protein